MRKRGKATFIQTKKNLTKIRGISAKLAQAEEFGGLTTQPLAELLHGQARELARICHQFSYLHSRKEGDN